MQTQQMQEENQKAINQKQTELLQKQLAKDTEKNAHKRAFERHTIFAVANMVLMNNSQAIDGVITEISQGGVKFRPASLYLLERNGERVSMIIDDINVAGIIRASRADGYGIQLLEEISNKEMDYIVRSYASEEENKSKNPQSVN